MSCNRPELNERLVELLDVPESEELRAHVSGCATCASELEAMRESFSALESYRVAPPSDAVLDRARIAGRKAAPARTTLALAAGLVAAAGMTVFVGVQPGAFHQLGAMLSAPLLVLAYLFGIQAAAKGGAWNKLFAISAAAGLAIALGSQPEGGDTPWCLPLGTAVGLVPTLIAGLALRRSLSTGAGLRGAVLGAGSGALGVAVFRLHCPFGGLGHALMFHAPIVLLTALVGFGLMQFSRPAEQT